MSVEKVVYALMKPTMSGTRTSGDSTARSTGQGEDDAQRERAGDVDDERAPREASAGQVVHPALQQVAGDGAGGTSDGDPGEGHGAIVAPRTPRAGPCHAACHAEAPTVGHER